LNRGLDYDIKKHFFVNIFISFKNFERLVIAVNRQFILKGMIIVSSKSPILPIMVTLFCKVLQLTRKTKLTLALNPETKLTLESGTNPTKPY